MASQVKLETERRAGDSAGPPLYRLLTNKVVNAASIMLELDVIDTAEAAALTLDPVKRRILVALNTPGSAASVADRVGLTRQKVNYHLRALEEHGLVTQVDERRWGGLTERVMAASAASYVLSPDALGPIATDPDRSADRLSASYLIALAARIVREVGALWRRARSEDRRLATLSLDTVIHFRTAGERAAFADELTRTVADLAARYHDDGTPGSRPHRLVIAAHPVPRTSDRMTERTTDPPTD